MHTKCLVVKVASSATALALRVQRRRFLVRDRLRRSAGLASLLVARRGLLALQDVLLVLKVTSTASLSRMRENIARTQVTNVSHVFGTRVRTCGVRARAHEPRDVARPDAAA